ncbi:MAG TPA: hypothetical protein VFC61_02475 [Blastocatellia bacterium]|nr:hypothetical protein [Blastocatellia bacterium]
MKMQVLKIFSMLLLAVTPAAAAVSATLDGALKATIPFEFSVGDKTLPAGVYTVASTTTPGMLRIRGEESHAGVLIPARDVQNRRPQGRSNLTFRRYGDRYFLAQIWTERMSNGRELWKSRTERELIKSKSENLAKSAMEPEVVYIAAQ